MTKKTALAHWQGLEEQQAILPHWDPIPYKAKGSTYGACGIRIDGNPAFIDAVLSRLKDLIAGENHATRLTLARNTVQTKLEIGGQSKTFNNTADHAEVCYIRLHERGHEAKRVSVFCDRHLDKPTREFFGENTI